jgi:hypothetical protein
MKDTSKPQRRRIIKETLVASTNEHRRIISKRLIVNVIYSPLSYKILTEYVTDIRVSFQQ